MSFVRSLAPLPRDVANPTFAVYTHTSLVVRAPDAPSLVSPSLQAFWRLLWLVLVMIKDRVWSRWFRCFTWITWGGIRPVALLSRFLHQRSEVVVNPLHDFFVP
jgi:hypothetical protein